MSPEEQRAFPIDTYLNFFKSFFILLAIGYFVGGLILKYLSSPPIYISYTVLSPCVAFIYFLFKSRRFSKKTLLINIITIGLSLFTLFTAIAIQRGFSPSIVSQSAKALHINGMYSTTILLEDIQQINVRAVPPIKKKLNGFSYKNYRKGHFITTSGDTVLLYTTSNSDSCIYIQSSLNHYYLDFNDKFLAEIQQAIKN